MMTSGTVLMTAMDREVMFPDRAMAHPAEAVPNREARIRPVRQRKKRIPALDRGLLPAAGMIVSQET